MRTSTSTRHTRRRRSSRVLFTPPRLWKPPRWRRWTPRSLPTSTTSRYAGFAPDRTSIHAAHARIGAIMGFINRSSLDLPPLPPPPGPRPAEHWTIVARP